MPKKAQEPKVKPKKSLGEIKESKTSPQVSTRRRLLQFALLAILIFSGYILFLQLSPQKKVLDSKQQELFIASVPESSTNRLIIPKIAVNSEIFEGSAKVLDSGVWHRYPERGNPQEGGNFILAAHRYVFAWLPAQTSQKSILYNIDKLTIDDTLYVDYNGKRYVYKVVEKKLVKPTENYIEDPVSKEKSQAKLTLYSCTLNGERDGREVIIAIPQKY